MRTGYIGLGSNVGDREAELSAAVGGLRDRGIEVEAVSSLYETEPVGEVLDQPDFLNAVVRMRTDLEPEELLDVCKEIEAERGRDFSAPRHSPRPVDLDLLLLDDVELETERLTLPHREVTSRRFVLMPLLELDPELVVRGKPLTEALAELGEGERVEKAGAWMSELRVLRPAENVLAFYEGRQPGHRFAEGPNWVDMGALELGIASYAILDGPDALVYDTHVAVDRAEEIRRVLREEGAERFTVVLSHWHLDHVAGTAAFEGSEVIANERTAEHLREKGEAIQAGTLEGPPAIDPLVQPTRAFSDVLTLRVGQMEVDLIEANIHSDDATVLWLPDRKLLLCGDTMEDTVTYVDEPQNFETHLDDLDRLWDLDPERILPNHGDPDVISSGGYGKELIRATQQYIRVLGHSRENAALREQSLSELIAGPLRAGWVNYFEPYEEVHRLNLKTVTGDAG